MKDDYLKTIHNKRPNRPFMGYNHNTYCNLGSWHPPRTTDADKVTCAKCIYETTDLSMEEAEELAKKRRSNV